MFLWLQALMLRPIFSRARGILDPSIRPFACPAVVVVPLLCLASTEGQAADAFDVTYQQTEFHVLRLAQGEEQDLRFFWRRADGSAYGGIPALRRELADHGETLRFAVNGGIYARDLTPLGLYVEDGRKLAPLQQGHGGGNFFLKPNGVFYVSDRGAGVVATDDWPPPGNVRNAVQSGPMLVIDGRLHPRFIPDYHSRYIRNGVGVDEQGRVVFAISASPVNFHDFGTLFRDRLDCPNALYLDGKISQMHLPELGRRVFWSFQPLVSIIALTSPSR